jgi:sigma-54 dependent transcriptional regulator, acetoin dehydrogenase operon transcriptional activator AcoR
MRLVRPDACLWWSGRDERPPFPTPDVSTTDHRRSEEAGLAAAKQGRHVATGRPRPAGSLRPAAPGSEELALARTAFLAEGRARTEVVREPILASWTRSRLWEVPTDHLEVPFDSDLDGESTLLRAARPVLGEAAEQFAAEPVSVILCDANGIVLTRDTGDSVLEDHLDRVWLAPGFSYAEQHVGTNGIGTALEGGGPARVFGHEHYVEHLEDFACAGVPIRHPVTHKVLGVVDLTCWRRDAGAMMAAAAAALGRRIEATLLEQAGRREHALLHDYLVACRRNRDAVIAVGNDVLMLNDRARELLAPADQGPLLAEAMEALVSGHRQQMLVDLPSGLTARVQCKPSFVDGAASGGVVQVQLIGQLSAAPGRAPMPPSLPAAVGSGALWTKCRQAVDRAFSIREWVVLEGERGTGKTTLARAVHQSRTPAAHLRIFDATEHSSRWVADLIDELATGGGTLVLTHLDRLPPEALPVLVDVLEPHQDSTDPDGHWVVATIGKQRGDRDTDLASLLSLFPRTVEVPPLRHHIEDVAELVPHLLTRLTRGGNLSVSPAVMRVLMRNLWSGNVEQLYQVLRTTVARRRSGVVELGDLPPECRATTRRVLTPLEAIECDAIVDALLDTDGNKAEAARQLGMSRATIYRKIRGYGLSVPVGG